MESGTTGVALREIELSAEELLEFKTKKRQRAVSRLFLGLAYAIIGFIPQWANGHRSPPLLTTWTGRAIVLVWLAIVSLFVLLWWSNDRAARAIQSCRFRYTMLPEGLQLVIEHDGKRRHGKNFPYIIPWWRVVSKIDESNHVQLNPPDESSPYKVPAKCFDNDDVRALFTRLAYRG